jgi:hypothetical protein
VCLELVLLEQQTKDSRVVTLQIAQALLVEVEPVKLDLTLQFLTAAKVEMEWLLPLLDHPCLTQEAVVVVDTLELVEPVALVVEVLQVLVALQLVLLVQLILAVAVEVEPLTMAVQHRLEALEVQG